MGIIETVGAIVLVVFMLGLLFGVIAFMFSDTETFQTIDEKIAKLIKGADDE